MNADVTEAQIDTILFVKALKEEQARFYPNPHPAGSAEYFQHERDMISMQEHMLPVLQEQAAVVRKQFG